MCVRRRRGSGSFWTIDPRPEESQEGRREGGGGGGKGFVRDKGAGVEKEEEGGLFVAVWERRTNQPPLTHLLPPSFPFSRSQFHLWAFSGAVQWRHRAATRATSLPRLRTVAGRPQEVSVARNFAAQKTCFVLCQDHRRFYFRRSTSFINKNHHCYQGRQFRKHGTLLKTSLSMGRTPETNSHYSNTRCTDNTQNLGLRRTENIKLLTLSAA